MSDKTRRELFESDRLRKASLGLPVMRVRWSRSKYKPRADRPKDVQREILLAHRIMARDRALLAALGDK